jgi:hypothetical protein
MSKMLMKKLQGDRSVAAVAVNRRERTATITMKDGNTWAVRPNFLHIVAKQVC